MNAGIKMLSSCLLHVATYLGRSREGILFWFVGTSIIYGLCFAPHTAAPFSLSQAPFFEIPSVFFFSASQSQKYGWTCCCPSVSFSHKSQHLWLYPRPHFRKTLHVLILSSYSSSLTELMSVSTSTSRAPGKVKSPEIDSSLGLHDRYVRRTKEKKPFFCPYFRQALPRGWTNLLA